MSTAEHDVVPATQLSSLEALEPVARAVFGEGQRPRGWFARKLAREVVSAEGSRVVVQRTADRSGTSGVLGYGLLGLPASLGPVARTAGIGLRPEARGHGLGNTLLQTLVFAAHELGRDILEVPASEPSVGFYQRGGLLEHARVGTWLAFGRGPAPLAPAEHREPPVAWTSSPVHAVLTAWLAEAWDRTPATARYRWRDELQTLDVSQEGRAHVVHRWSAQTTGAAAVDGLARWLDALRDGTPALLPYVPQTDARLESALDAAGWVRVQTTVMMRRTTRPG